jgi:AcrR family transcriptional regulator
VITQALTATGPKAQMLKLLDLWLDLNRRIVLGEAPAIAVFNDIRALQKPQRRVVVDRYMVFFDKLRSIFVSPQLAWLDERSITARAHVLTEQIFWAAAWLPRFDVEDYDRIRDRMYDILVHGLAGRGQQWQPSVLPIDKLQATDQELSARETFLIAATRLINERGYRGASVEKISARLNVTKGSFYHHNDAKDDLVVECFKRSFETMRKIQLSVYDSPQDQWAQLSSIAATLVDYQLSDYGPLLRTSALSALPPSIRTEMVLASNRVSDRFSGIICDGIASGCVRAVDPFLASQMLTATLNASAEVKWWVQGATRQEAVELYAKPMLMGLLS